MHFLRDDGKLCKPLSSRKTTSQAALKLDSKIYDIFHLRRIRSQEMVSIVGRDRANLADISTYQVNPWISKAVTPRDEIMMHLGGSKGRDQENQDMVWKENNIQRSGTVAALTKYDHNLGAVATERIEIR